MNSLNSKAFLMLMIFSTLIYPSYAVQRQGGSQLKSVFKSTNLCDEVGNINRAWVVDYVQKNIAPTLAQQYLIPFIPKPKWLLNPDYRLTELKYNIDFHSAAHSLWATLSIKRMLPEVGFSENYEAFVKSILTNNWLHSVELSLDNFNFSNLGGESVTGVYDLNWLIILLSELTWHTENYGLDNKILSKVLVKSLNISLKSSLQRGGLKFFERAYSSDMEQTFGLDLTHARKPAIPPKTPDQVENSRVFHVIVNSTGQYDDAFFTLATIRQALRLPLLTNDPVMKSISERYLKLRENAITYFSRVGDLILGNNLGNFTHKIQNDFVFTYAYLSELDSAVSLPESLSSSLHEKFIKNKVKYENSLKNNFSDGNFNSHSTGLYVSTAWFYANRWRLNESDHDQDCQYVHKVLNQIESLPFVYKTFTQKEFSILVKGYELLQKFYDIKVKDLRDYTKVPEGIDRIERKIPSFKQLDAQVNGTHWIPQYAWRALYLMMAQPIE